MSFYTWHTYGYGICVSDIDCESIEKLKKLLHQAPGVEKHYNLGLATFLKEVILECEGIELTACSDLNDNLYLLYEPTYPWNLPKEQISLTKERIKEIILKYVSILTEKQIEIGYYDPENGG